MADLEELKNSAKKIMGAFMPNSVTNEEVGALFINLINYFNDIKDNGQGGGGDLPPDQFWSKEDLVYLSGFLYVLGKKINAGLSESLRSPDFISGIAGSGIGTVANSELHADRIVVRKDFSVSEMIIQQMIHTGGEDIKTVAAGKIVSVELLENGYKCTLEGQNLFQVDDQARCNMLNDISYKYYWRLVTEVGDDYIVLSKTDKDGEGIPSAGDNIIQLGNRTSERRRSAIISTTTGVNAPSTSYLDMITDYSLSGKTVVYIGKDGETGKMTIHVSGGIFENITVRQSSMSGFTEYNGIVNKIGDADKKAENAQNEINNLQIGGTNYLLRDIQKKGWYSNAFGSGEVHYYDDHFEFASSSTEAAINGIYNSWQDFFTKDLTGKNIVIGFDAKSDTEGVTAHVYSNKNLGYTKTITLTTNYKRYFLKVTRFVPASSALIFSSTAKDTKYYFKDFKVEEGDKGTDYSLSQKDQEELASQSGSIAAQDKIDNLQIGGVNLINKSESLILSSTDYPSTSLREPGKITVVAAGKWNAYNIYSDFADGVLNSQNKEFVVSVDIKTNRDVIIYTRYQWQGPPHNYGSEVSFECKAGKWIRFSYPAKTPATPIRNFAFQLYSDNSDTTGLVVEYRHYMLEQGNKSSESWKPALRDQQEQINEAKEQAQSATDKLTDWASDSKISPPEKAGLKQQLADIQSEYNELKARAEKLSLSLETEWINYYYAFVAARDALNKYTASSPESIVIESDYANISAYYPKRQALLLSLSNTESSDKIVKIIDATGLDQNLYYPVTMRMGLLRGTFRLKAEQYDSYPSWSTHNDGTFTCECSWEENPSGWGWNEPDRYVNSYDYKFADKPPIGSIGQMNRSSHEYIYVRGGGKYRFTTYNVSEIMLRTEPFTASADTIAPVTTVDRIVVDVREAKRLANETQFLKNGFRQSNVSIADGVVLSGGMFVEKSPGSGIASAGMAGYVPSGFSKYPMFFCGAASANEANSAKIAFYNDGDGWVANKNISWDAAGNATFKGIIYALGGEFSGLIKAGTTNKIIIDPDDSSFKMVAGSTLLAKFGFDESSFPYLQLYQPIPGDNTLTTLITPGSIVSKKGNERWMELTPSTLLVRSLYKYKTTDSSVADLPPGFIFADAGQSSANNTYMLRIKL